MRRRSLPVGGWRCGELLSALLLPLAAFTWLLLWMIDVAVTCYALAATVIYLAAERIFERPERLSRLLFGCSVKELAAETPTGPVCRAFLLIWRPVC